MNHDPSYFNLIDDEYETCKMTYVEFCIYGEELDPASVTARLGIEPSREQGEMETLMGMDYFAHQRNASSWLLSSRGQVESRDVRRHLDWLLEKLVPVQQQVLKLQTMADVKMTVRCIWWSAYGDGGPALWPQQMSLLADLNLECSFDVLFFEETDEGDALEMLKSFSITTLCNAKHA